MFNSLFRRNLVPLFTVLFCLVSCVDNDYDLSDVDTDDLTVGDKWSLNLGTGVLSASELLDVDNVDEIFTDPNGDYIARYTSVISVTPSRTPVIRDQSFELGSVPIPLQGIGAIPPQGVEISVDRTSGQLEIKGADGIEELYRAELNTAADKSLLGITVRTSDFTIPGTTAVVNLTLPDGYVIDTDYTPAGVRVDGTEIEWTFPLGSANDYTLSLPVSTIDVSGDNTVTVEAVLKIPGSTVVDLGPDPSVAYTVSFGSLDYKVVYGKFDITFSSSPKTADIGKLYDIFDDEDAVLSFREPYILLDARSNIGMPVAAVLEITPDGDGSGSEVRVEDIPIPAAPEYGGSSFARFWIGETDPGSSDYIFKYAEGMGDVIKESRENIYLAGSGRSAATQGQQFFPADARADLEYTIEIPLAPARDFYAVSVQSLEDAFGDMRDYLFSAGTAEIYGTATNSMPLNFDFEMIITGEDGQSVGITFPIQYIAGPVSPSEPSVSEISFYFDEAAVARMATAQDMELRFVATGMDQAPALNSGHEVLLDLKIRKSGGIHID
ncbi:MAG: DUF4621 domain-containing protein [Alistipes sp.]|nr:DUF4621 domain-containing protein [Alistipes sp.]